MLYVFQVSWAFTYARIIYGWKNNTPRLYQAAKTLKQPISFCRGRRESQSAWKTEKSPLNLWTLSLGSIQYSAIDAKYLGKACARRCRVAKLT